jgi:16S rRNA G966 N2-methylase RsmD
MGAVCVYRKEQKTTMARLESKVIMGYLPIEERHYQALFSLVAPATPDHKLLDPMAGSGEFLQSASQAWNITPYANELDQARAQDCIRHFGPQQAVQGDVERLSASLEAFGMLWINPPYDHDAQATDNKRVEFRYLRHCWKWSQVGAVVMWVIYQHHLTEPASEFLAKNSASVDVWALPGKHLNTYDQIVVVAIKGTHDDPEALYQSIRQAKSDPLPLTIQPEPLYKLPKPRQLPRFTFAPDTITPEAGLQLIETQGAWKSCGR